jgi:hypothetical protein
MGSIPADFAHAVELVEAGANAAEDAGWPHEPLPAGAAALLEQVDGDLGALAEDVATAGQPAIASELAAENAYLDELVEHVEAQGVSALDIAKLSVVHARLLDTANHLDSLGLNAAAAQARLLAARVAEITSSVTHVEAQSFHELGGSAPTVLSADDINLMEEIEDGLTALSDQVAEHGDPVLAHELTLVQDDLAEDLARMREEFVTEADFAEGTVAHDQLVGVAELLDAEGLEADAAQAWALAAELSDVIAELTISHIPAEAAAGHAVVVAADEHLVEVARSAAGADRERVAEGGIPAGAASLFAAGAGGSPAPTLVSAPAERNPLARTPVASVPTGRLR